MTMTEADRERFKSMLLRQQAELEELDESSREAAKPVKLDQASVGRLSRMDAIRAQQMARESERRRRQQLVKIEAALRRIEAGEFGCCLLCGEEIDIRRLSVDPTSTRCIACAEQ
jgi:DnaK suppressor protein